MTGEKWPDKCSCCDLDTYIGNLCSGFGGSIICQRCGHSKGRHGIDLDSLFVQKE